MILTLSAVPLAAQADTGKTMQVAGRALSFLENGPSGATTIGIVFDPSKPGSVAEKNAVMAALSGGLATGAVTLSGKAVEADAVSGASGVSALYLTKGVNYAAVGAAAKARKLVTISSDKSCASSGACVMSVASEPSVDITVNHTAASAIGAAFKSTFRMLIHEI